MGSKARRRRRSINRLIDCLLVDDGPFSYFFHPREMKQRLCPSVFASFNIRKKRQKAPYILTAKPLILVVRTQGRGRSQLLLLFSRSIAIDSYYTYTLSWSHSKKHFSEHVLSYHPPKQSASSSFYSLLKSLSFTAISFVQYYPPKFYPPFCPQHLYSTYPKYNLLRLQLTVSPPIKLRMLPTKRRSF